MRKAVNCFFCKAEVPKADNKARAVLCSNCVARLAGSPAAIKKVPSPIKKKPVKVKKERKPAKIVSATKGFGRGWHLKKNFVAPNGDKYSFGQKV